MKFKQDVEKGLSRAARVEIFRRIRDQPYCIDYLHPWQDCSAIGKAQWFQDELAVYSMPVRLIYCQFKWEDTLVPRHLQGKTAGGLSWHVYPEVLVPETNRWVAVDPTLDSGLKAAGFPVAEWDGLNPTVLAVRPFRTFTPDLSERAINDFWDEMVRHPTEMHQSFGSLANALNEWMNRQRRMAGAPHA